MIEVEAVGEALQLGGSIGQGQATLEQADAEIVAPGPRRCRDRRAPALNVEIGLAGGDDADARLAHRPR